MAKYIAKRVLISIVTLWVLVTVVFVLVRCMPGDPFQGDKMTPEIRANMEAYYGFDKSLPEQYIQYIQNLLHGDFGYSMKYTNQSVNKIITQTFPYSFDLGIRALAFAISFGLVFGILAALHRGKKLDYVCVVIAILGTSIPDFIMGAILQYLFGIKWGLLPVAQYLGFRYTILPSIGIGFYTLAMVSRLMRASMLEVVQQDYIKTAKSKGISKMKIIYKHQIRNAITPVVTVLGPIVASVLCGTFVIESIFAIPGMGKYYVESVQNLDYSLVLGMTVFFGFFLILANLIVDILYGIIDPQYAYRKAGDHMVGEQRTNDDFVIIGKNLKRMESISRPSLSYWKDAWRRLTKNKIAILSLVLIFIYILLAVFVPIFSKYGYADVDSGKMNQFLSTEHWFGTDSIGRDLWVRVWRGARVSLSIGFIAAILNAVLGAFVGGISGYYGGKIDMVIMRIIDVLYGIPALIVTILVMVVLGSGINSLIIAMVIVGWIGTARFVRGEVMRLKGQDFVAAAKILGVGNFRIIIKHVLPNIMGLIITNLMMAVPNAIFREAFLSYIGLGIAPPECSWGILAKEGAKMLRIYPHELFIPAFFICTTMLAMNLLGDGLRDALDPKLRGSE